MTIKELWYFDTLTSDDVQRTVDICILDRNNLPKDNEGMEKLDIILRIGALSFARDLQIILSDSDRAFIEKCPDYLENYVDEVLHNSTLEFVESHIFPRLDVLYYRMAQEGRGISNYDDSKNDYLRNLRGVVKTKN